MANQTIYSFDVFDTCLTRSSSSPMTVFYIMADHVSKTVMDRPVHYEFVNARMKAERKARSTAIPGKKEDVTIDEIYQNIEIELGDFCRNDLVKLELEVEASVLRPVNAIQKMVTELREKGERIVFVTDTYLPTDFIREQLVNNGFYKDGDGLYVSQEIGLAKFTGNLFDYVKDKEGTEFSRMRHYGDNVHADFKIPKSKGIRAYLVNTDFSKYEYEWSNNASGVRYPVEIYMMSGIAKSLRLSGTGNVHDNLVLNTIAPMFVPFVSWILRDARARGITTLYFLARDGFILFEIAKILGKDYPEIQLRYLFGSRRAFYIAGLTEASREEFHWIMAGPYGKTPRQMLLRLNTPPEAIATAMEKHSVSKSFLDTPLDKNSYELFLDILTTPPSPENILAISQEHRSLVRDYFQQEGMFRDGDKAIVDIGWSRFCQRVMNVVLEKSKAFGYFFSVFDERLDINEAGPYAAAFYPEEFYNDDCNKNLLKHEFLLVLEQFFAFAGQPSTIGFERKQDKIIPVFEKQHERSAKFKDYLRLHVDLVRKFAAEYQKIEYLIQDPEILLRNCGYRSAQILINSPTKEEAEIFHEFMVDNGVEDEVPLVRKLGFLRLFKMMKDAVLSIPGPRNFIWTEGTIVWSFGDRGLAVLKLGRQLKDMWKKGRFRNNITVTPK